MLTVQDKNKEIKEIELTDWAQSELERERETPRSKHISREEIRILHASTN